MRHTLACPSLTRLILEGEIGSLSTVERKYRTLEFISATMASACGGCSSRKTTSSKSGPGPGRGMLKLAGFGKTTGTGSPNILLPVNPWGMFVVRHRFITVLVAMPAVSERFFGQNSIIRKAPRSPARRMTKLAGGHEVSERIMVNGSMGLLGRSSLNYSQRSAVSSTILGVIA